MINQHFTENSAVKMRKKILYFIWSNALVPAQKSKHETVGCVSLTEKYKVTMAFVGSSKNSSLEMYCCQQLKVNLFIFENQGCMLKKK